MSLHSVDSTGIAQRVIDRVVQWQEWLDDEDAEQPRFVLFLWQTVSRRDAEYVVQCLQTFLPEHQHQQQQQDDGNPQEEEGRKITELNLDGGDGISNAAIAVFCDYLRQQPAEATATSNCNLESLSLFRMPRQQYRRVLESLHTNMSVKKLELSQIHVIEGTRWMSNLLHHKTNLTVLIFKDCNVRMEAMGPLLSNRGLRLLRKLVFYDCSIGDEGVGFIRQAIHEGTLPLLDELSVHRNGITSVSLPLLAEMIPAVLPYLQKLDLSWNQGLFNDLQSTRLFVQNMLLSNDMILKELCIRWCGQYTPVVIAACENDKNKLQVLDIFQSSANAQPIIDQLVISLPKMKMLKSFEFNPELLFHHHRNNGPPAIMAALHENSSIVKLVPTSDAPTRRCIALLLHRNQGLEHADALLVSMQPQTGLPIHSKSGLWYMAFAKLAQVVRASDLIKKDLYGMNRFHRGISEARDRDGNNHAVYTGASAVFKILQKRPAILESQLKRPVAETIAAATAAAAVAVGPQQKRARRHSSSAKYPGKKASSATTTAATAASSMRMVDDTDKKMLLDSLAREELVEMIQQKDQQIAEQDITISQQAVTIAEQADIITRHSLPSKKSTEQKKVEMDQDQKMPARKRA